VVVTATLEVPLTDTQMATRTAAEVATAPLQMAMEEAEATAVADLSVVPEATRCQI